MVGTVAGGRKAAATNKAKYGADFYAKIGSEGGSRGHTGGFASEKVGDDGLTGFERARIAGRKGGAISKRGPAKNNPLKLKKSYLDAVKAYAEEYQPTLDIDAELKNLERQMKSGD